MDISVFGNSPKLMPLRTFFFSSQWILVISGHCHYERSEEPAVRRLTEKHALLRAEATQSAAAVPLCVVIAP
jgi:hypothetical protein